VLAGMNVNIWDVNEAIGALVGLAAGQQGRAEDASIPLESLA